MNVVFVTSNDHKAKYFSRMVGVDIEHVSLELDEIQSLDVKKVVAHKAKQAYELLKRPVLVEDTSLEFRAMGSLPGTFIKWFLDELNAEGLCALVNSLEYRDAVASAAVAYFDGKTLEVFERKLEGTIADSPKGTSGFGWNVIFVPDGQNLTLGEMDEQAFEHYYKQIKPFEEVYKFLTNS